MLRGVVTGSKPKQCR